MQSDTAADLSCSLVTLSEATEGPLQHINTSLVHDLGAVLMAMTSPENDLWADASGNSLRDLAEAIALP